MRGIDYQSAAGMLERAGWTVRTSYANFPGASVVWEKGPQCIPLKTHTVRCNDYWVDRIASLNWGAMELSGVEEFVNFAAAMELCS